MNQDVESRLLIRVTVRVISPSCPIWKFGGALLVLAFLGPYAALLVHYQVLSVHGAQAAGWMQAAIGIR